MQKETTDIVAAIVDQEKESAKTKQYTHLNTASDIDTDDDTDEEELEFEQWKRRELDRIKREDSMRDPTAAKDTDDAAQTAAAVRPSCRTSVTDLPSFVLSVDKQFPRASWVCSLSGSSRWGVAVITRPCLQG